MKNFRAHLISILSLLAFVFLAYASTPSRSDFERKKKVDTEESIMNNPNLSDKEKADMIAKRKAKFDKERKTKTVLATTLAEEYESNEVSADAKYKNKVFFVDGVIEDISKDLFDKIYVSLVGYDVFGSVSCYINDAEAVMKLSKGQRIIVRGRCDGTMLGVDMKDCEIIEVFEAEEGAETTEEEEGV